MTVQNTLFSDFCGFIHPILIHRDKNPAIGSVKALDAC